VYQAVAVRGEGVAETFLGMVSLLHESLDREQGLSALLGLSRAEFVEAVRRCFAQPPPLPPLQAVLTPAGGVPRLAKSSGS
jgi:hypothetical protein